MNWINWWRRAQKRQIKFFPSQVVNTRRKLDKFSSVARESILRFRIIDDSKRKTSEVLCVTSRWDMRHPDDSSAPKSDQLEKFRINKMNFPFFLPFFLAPPLNVVRRRAKGERKSDAEEEKSDSRKAFWVLANFDAFAHSIIDGRACSFLPCRMENYSTTTKFSALLIAVATASF